jgi:hypothetical protein
MAGGQVAAVPEGDGDGESAGAVEPYVDEAPGVVAVGADDVFISARRVRRVRMPASLRRGRHQAKDSRRALDATSCPAGSSARMRLVDVDGQAETARIELRRRFEEISATDSSDTDLSGELRQSAAG